MTPLQDIKPMESQELTWPAEWEEQEAIWLSWPHRNDLWQGTLDQLQQDYVKLTALIADRAKVYINAAEQLHPQIRHQLLQAHVEESQVKLYNHPTNDVWCRDHGGIFVRRSDQKLQIANWQFNAWGGKFAPWDLDNAIPQHMAQSQNIPTLNSQLILEGGAIEGNGDGLLITTEAVLLNPNRNPSWSKQQIEAELNRMLGTQQTFWLGQGIEGDDTDGHIDDMVRFVAKDRILSIVDKNPKSPHYRALAENNERLQDIRLVNGGKIEIIELPMPQALIVDNWRLEQLPASYANFLICNKRVIVPIFQQSKQDSQALGIIQEAFGSTYEVVGMDARGLVIEGGAIHCITQQQVSYP